MGGIRALAADIFATAAAAPPYSDQTVLNLLLLREPYLATTLFDDDGAGWACHAHTMARQSRGERLSYRFRGREPLFDGNVVYTAGGHPFCVVHQYDRVPSWKQALEARFG